MSTEGGKNPPTQPVNAEDLFAGSSSIPGRRSVKSRENDTTALYGGSAGFGGPRPRQTEPGTLG